ncbi:hypothetical protein [Chitinimonas sp. BJB300]|uniref:hypothetical protein n=1 Tax=Chitinimonas sp. BJB300 TaxID=1559339 RepID=UPI000C10ADE9|nr:hypothetical protein [Chitinimonas sp. BJB300]PHV12693.1 hypothetical protein CSQ89_04455 [Chitinimonas sp. BJB300]TSJ91262.1 hypothetical protein FG002_002925 [Chitinimonas sp. BJB300]
MEAELQNLEDRINSLAAICQQLRTENVALRQEVLVLKGDNKRLVDKVEIAKSKVDALLEQLPEEAE